MYGRASARLDLGGGRRSNLRTLLWLSPGAGSGISEPFFRTLLCKFRQQMLTLNTCRGGGLASGCGRLTSGHRHSVVLGIAPCAPAGAYSRPLALRCVDDWSVAVDDDNYIP